MPLPELIAIVDAVLYNATGLLLVVLGVFVLIRATGFPDLTVDGSFTFGAALYCVLLLQGVHVVAALAATMIAGAVSGSLTWFINQRLGVGKVVSGVLSMIVLTLSAPYVASGATKSLLNLKDGFAALDRIDVGLTEALLGHVPFQLHIGFILAGLALFGVCLASVITLLRSRIGLRLRYSGSSTAPTFVPAKERAALTLLGLSFGNALVALGGAIEAQRRGGYTSGMGAGILLVALAVMVLGESYLKSRHKREYLHLTESMTSLIIGTIAYCAGVQLLLLLRVDFIDLRLLTALFLMLLLGIAGRRHSSTTRLF